MESCSSAVSRPVNEGDAEFQIFFDELIAPDLTPRTPHASAVRKKEVLSHAGGTIVIAPYRPWIGWLVDPDTSEERQGIEAVMRQACELLGYSFCWVRGLVTSSHMNELGLVVLRDKHIPVYFGRDGNVVVEGHVYCVLDEATRVPVRMMKPDEVVISPKGTLPVELWLFREEPTKNKPINVIRHFTEPGRVVRERQRLADLEKQSQDRSGDKVDCLLGNREPDLVVFDGEEDK